MHRQNNSQKNCQITSITCMKEVQIAEKTDYR